MALQFNRRHYRDWTEVYGNLFKDGVDPRPIYLAFFDAWHRGGEQMFECLQQEASNGGDPLRNAQAEYLFDHIQFVDYIKREDIPF